MPKRMTMLRTAIATEFNQEIERLAKEKKKTFNEMVNIVLYEGLNQIKKNENTKPFRNLES